MKNCAIFVFLFINLSIPLWAEESPVVLRDILQQAHEHNPQIKSAFQKWKVMDREAGAATVWPNPKLSYIDEKDPMGVEGTEPLTRKHYGVEQDIPFPGKLSKEGRMKHHEALIAEANYRDVVLDIDRQIKIVLAKLGSNDQLIKLAEENVGSLRRTLTSTQSRLAANKAMTSDVFMVQMELRRVENLVYEKKQNRRALEIELNALLDEPIEREWPLVFPAPELRELPLSLAQLESLAMENNPDFQSAHHELNHSQAMLARSRLEYLPDIGVMYEYQTAGDGSGGTGPAGRQLGLSLSVPLWLKRPMRLNAGAKEHVQEAEAGARVMQNMVKKMVAMEWNETITHTALARKIEEEILPAAQGALNITRQQYAAGQGDFLRLLEANRTWINMHIEHQEQLYHVNEHWSELEKWVGTDLSSIPQENKNEK